MGFSAFQSVLPVVHELCVEMSTVLLVATPKGIQRAMNIEVMASMQKAAVEEGSRELTAMVDRVIHITLNTCEQVCNGTSIVRNRGGMASTLRSIVASARATTAVHGVHDDGSNSTHAAALSTLLPMDESVSGSDDLLMEATTFLRSKDIYHRALCPPQHTTSAVERKELLFLRRLRPFLLLVDLMVASALTSVTKSTLSVLSEILTGTNGSEMFNENLLIGGSDVLNVNCSNKAPAFITDEGAALLRIDSPESDVSKFSEPVVSTAEKLIHVPQMSPPDLFRMVC
jgi:hypothetical protein